MATTTQHRPPGKWRVAIASTLTISAWLYLAWVVVDAEPVSPGVAYGVASSCLIVAALMLALAWMWRTR